MGAIQSRTKYRAPPARRRGPRGEVLPPRPTYDVAAGPGKRHGMGLSTKNDAPRTPRNMYYSRLYNHLAELEIAKIRKKYGR